MSTIYSENFDKGIFSSIGKTPLIKLDHLFPQRKQEIYAKLEFLNPGGSHKDYPALHLIKEAIRTGLVHPGTTLIETTSGNLGIGLAQVCLKLKLRLILVVDPLCCQQNIDLAKAYGANIVMVKEKDKTGNYHRARLSRLKELLHQNPEYVWMNQLGNQFFPFSHKRCVGEILDELNNDLDYIYIPTSSCGTLVGCREEIESRKLDTKIIPVDAEGSQIFETSSGKFELPGLGASRTPEYLDSAKFDPPLFVNDLECIIGCRQLLENEAILAGASTGAAVFAIRKSIHRLPLDAKVAFLVADRGERYLNTIYNNQWVIDNFTKSHPFIFTNPYLA
jgi:N-(2-amino-2-carboxyethyl)-L-glutamate synthase